MVRGLNCTVQTRGRGKSAPVHIFVSRHLKCDAPACRSGQSLEEQLKKLVQIVDCVCVDVQRAQNFYNKLFYRRVCEARERRPPPPLSAGLTDVFVTRSTVKVDFLSISYRQLEKQVGSSGKERRRTAEDLLSFDCLSRLRSPMT